MIDGHLRQIPAHERILVDRLAEGLPIRCVDLALQQAAADDSHRGEGVVQPFEVQHLGHVLEPALGFADEIALRTLEDDLARRDADGAEFVLQATIGLVVERPVLAGVWDQKQREPVGPLGGVRAAGQRERPFGVDVRAEPLLACESIGAVFGLFGSGLVRADVATALLLGEEHRALDHVLVVPGGEPIEVLLEVAVVEPIQHERDATGHRDGARESGVGVREQAVHQEVVRERQALVPIRGRSKGVGDDSVFVREALVLELTRMVFDVVPSLAVLVVGI